LQAITQGVNWQFYQFSEVAVPRKIFIRFACRAGIATSMYVDGSVLYELVE
jgi:hypothetical protein